MTTQNSTLNVRLPSNWEEIIRHAASERRTVTVGPEEVSAALEWLRESRASEEQVIRPCRKGDVVTATIHASRNGVPIEGGTLNHHSFILGNGTLLPGLEEKIEGMAPGGEASFDLAVPPDYWKEELRGATLSFRVSVEAVRERTLPKLTDDFARAVGRFKDLKDLKAKIAEGLLEEKREKEKERMRILMLERLAEAMKPEIPDWLIEEEARRMVAELRAAVEDRGMEWHAYLMHLKRDEAGLRSDLRHDARRRATLALVLRAVADAVHVEVTPEEVEGEMQRVLSRYASPREAEEEVDAETLERYTRNIIRNEKTFQYLEKLGGI
jgi:trigger factor